MKNVLFILCFIFMTTAQVEAQETLQENTNEVAYIIAGSLTPLPFIFGQRHTVSRLDEDLFLTDHHLIYLEDHLYKTEGCLESHLLDMNEVCVSQEIFLDSSPEANLRLADPLLAFTGNYKVRVLGINESTNTLMVRFIDSEWLILTAGRPFVVICYYCR